jgi:hypothetical protein
MNQFKLLSLVVVFVLAAAGMLLPGCAGPGSKPDAVLAPDQCVSPKNLDQDIAPEAQVEALTCSFKTYEGVETLHMKVTLKNISDKPQRFRVNIFLDNGKAAGGLIPTSLTKALVAPGQSASFEYPFLQMTEKPKEVFLKITTSEP